MLRWLRQNCCPWNSTSIAAREGHLEVLRWARQSGCPWSESTCAAAGREATWRCCGGRVGRCPGSDVLECGAGRPLEVLQWARQDGCPWDHGKCARGEGRIPESASSGRVERVPWNGEDGYNAAQGGWRRC